MTAHQASCVAIAGRGLLIEGPPGSGKSSLALALIDRGAALVGDDGLELAALDGQLVARAHPRVSGLIEVRNLGILNHPCCAQAPIALVIVLDPYAPRYIDSPEPTWRAKVRLPLIRLWPDTPALPLRAELALQHFGLPMPG